MVVYQPDSVKSRITSCLKLATVMAVGMMVGYLVSRPVTDLWVRWRQTSSLEKCWRENWPFPRGKGLGAELARVLRCGGLLRPVTRTIRPGVTMVLDPQDFIGCAILTKGEWEPDIASVIREKLPKGGVFIDVGAHTGAHSLPAAVRVGPSGKVVAFEPNPRTIERLRRNIALSRASNIIVEPVACSDAETTLTLFGGPESDTGLSSLSEHNAELEVPGTTALPFSVVGRPIDHVVSELGLQRVDVMKIDVEGAELMVLQGARATLKRFHPMIVIEERPALLISFGATSDDLHSLLKELGYDDRRMVNSENFEYVAH